MSYTPLVPRVSLAERPYLQGRQRALYRARLSHEQARTRYLALRQAVRRSNARRKDGSFDAAAHATSLRQRHLAERRCQRALQTQNRLWEQWKQAQDFEPVYAGALLVGFVVWDGRGWQQLRLPGDWQHSDDFTTAYNAVRRSFRPQDALVVSR